MFAEPLGAFFGDFAEPATWKGAPVSVIFDDGHYLTGGVVDSTDPMVQVQAASVPGVAHGDAIVLRSVSYRVRGIEPDVTGQVLTLQLERQ